MYILEWTHVFRCLSDGLTVQLCCLRRNKMVWDEFYTTSGVNVGSDPTLGQSQSQDEIVNAVFGGNFGVRQKFGLHRVDK